MDDQTVICGNGFNGDQCYEYRGSNGEKLFLHGIRDVAVIPKNVLNLI